MKRSQRVLIFAVLVGLAMGYLLGNQLSLSNLIEMVPIWWLALSILLAAYSVFLHIVLHEAGHLLFGKLTGYRLIYFQTPFFRYEGHTSSFTKGKPLASGVLGQCLMSPPAEGTHDEKPYRLYLSGGLIVNLLTALLFYLGSFVLPEQWGFYSFAFSLPPFWMFLGNAMPFGFTDGRLLKEMKASALSRKMFFKQLQTAEWVESGRSLQEFPEDHFVEATNGEAQQSFLGEYPMLMEYQRRLAHYQFTAADQLLQNYLSSWDYMTSSYARQVGCEILFCHALFGRKEKAEEMRAHIEKFSGLKGQFERNYRVQAAYAFFVEIDVEKTNNILAAEQEKEGLVLNKMEQAFETQLKDWLKERYLVHLS